VGVEVDVAVDVVDVDELVVDGVASTRPTPGPVVQLVPSDAARSVVSAKATRFKSWQ
jgi:hypothetical protein